MPRKRRGLSFRLITQFETWIHHHNPETNARSKLRKYDNSLSSKKERVQHLADMMMFTVSWDQYRVVAMNCLAKSITANAIYYPSLQQNSCDAIAARQCSMLIKGVYILQDNAQHHVVHFAQITVHSWGFEGLPHFPLSHDIAPSNFHQEVFFKEKHFKMTFGILRVRFSEMDKAMVKLCRDSKSR